MALDAGHSEQGGIAGQRAWRGLRIAGGKPGETGEQPAAQPLGKHPQGGEEQCPAQPAAGRQADEQGPEQRET